MKVVRGVLLALISTVLVASVLSGVPAEAGYKPKPGGHFNVPRAGEKQYRIHKQLIGAIRHAKKGSIIRMSVFSWDRKFVAREIVKAKRRGVQVQILLNNHQFSGAQRLLRNQVGGNRWKKNFSYECKNGCRSKGENLHTKFFLFSHTGKARNVVMAGSVNFTDNSARNQYNDLFIKNDAPRLYRAYNRIFAEMRKDKRQRPAYWVQNVGKFFQVQVTPYPNFGPRNDPMLKILNRVKCFGAKGGTGNARNRTIVRVVMHAWNDPRGIYLARKMRGLYANGCDVRLMYGWGGEKVRKTFATRTKRGFVPVHTTGKDTNNDGFIDLYTHQKELLVNGNYGKDRSTRMVVTGSSNWNNAGLRGDELIFLVKKGGAYRNYATNFNWMWKHRSTRVKYIPYSSRTIAVGQARMLPDPSAELKRFGPAWEND